VYIFLIPNKVNSIIKQTNVPQTSSRIAAQKITSEHKFCEAHEETNLRKYKQHRDSSNESFRGPDHNVEHCRIAVLRLRNTTYALTSTVLTAGLIVSQPFRAATQIRLTQLCLATPWVLNKNRWKIRNMKRCNEWDTLIHNLKFSPVTPLTSLVSRINFHDILHLKFSVFSDEILNLMKFRQPYRWLWPKSNIFVWRIQLFFVERLATLVVNCLSFLITWKSSRHCYNINTGDYIHKQTVLTVLCVSNKWIREIVSSPTQNSLDSRIRVATPGLISTWNKALRLCTI
jgi:hypothetical protein